MNFLLQKFYYNGQKDHLELCLEPLGHFPVTAGIDDPQKLSELAAGLSNTSTQRSEEAIGQGSSLSAGGSGVVKHGHQKKDKYVAFTGQAHKLSSESGEKSLDVRPKVKRENEEGRYNQSDQQGDSKLIPGQIQTEMSVSDKESDSSKSFSISDTRQSHFDDGDERDTAMDTDAVTISRISGRSGPSSPMEVDLQCKDFPVVGVDDTEISSNQMVDATPRESSSTGGSPSFVRSDNHESASSTSQSQEEDGSSPEKTMYVTKKLGPGYTVLMKQPASTMSDSKEDVSNSDGEET